MINDKELTEEEMKIMAAKASYAKAIGDVADWGRRNESQFLGNNNNGNPKKVDKGSNPKPEKEKQVPIFTTFKYSRPFLHEAIILHGLPTFIAHAPEKDTILKFDNIQEPSRILMPPCREDHPYTPYEFANTDELLEYYKRAKAETLDTLYERAKSFCKKYTNQDKHKLNLLAIDIIWSYFQDKFGTTHYIVVTGANEAGKTSIGDTFGAIGYRTCNMTNPTAPRVRAMYFGIR